MGWNKYGAIKTIAYGRTFPSKLEARVFSQYVLLEKIGEITELKQYDTVELTLAKIKYKTDGSYLDKEGIKNYIEAKGMEGDRWRLIKQLWVFYGPGRLHVWKAKGKGLYEEVIVPNTCQTE